MKNLLCLMTLTTALVISSLAPAIAASNKDFENGILIYKEHHGEVYSTTWMAYPMTIEYYIDNSNKPASLLVALTADGKMSGFRGIISLNCAKPFPSYSDIVTSYGYSSEGYIGLDKAIRLADDYELQYGIPRPVVNNLFSEFCN